MTLGIVVKGLNAWHFGRKHDFYHEFLPQMIMLLSLFGFMDLMIIQKWLTNYPEMRETARAPAIINVMINLFLNGGQIPDESKELPVIDHQVFWSKLLLFLALICPPWMLFVKPLLLRREHDEK
jgi:V-type H+-transporting ATPase subunit a